MLQVDQEKLKRSWLDEALLEFQQANDPLVLQTRSLLSRIIASDAAHSRLLNTLALLEHTGSQRIMATQHGDGIDQATLRHVAEEANHAFFMKRQAEKTRGQPMEFQAADLLANSAARMYFKRLEALIHGRLKRQKSAAATYLYMSMIIEFRALWFYKLYQQSLKLAGNRISLKRILGEEEHHLSEMAQRLESAGELSNARARQFLQDEQRLYSRLLDAMRSELTAH